MLDSSNAGGNIGYHCVLVASIVKDGDGNWGKIDDESNKLLFLRLHYSLTKVYCVKRMMRFF